MSGLELSDENVCSLPWQFALVKGTVTGRAVRAKITV